MENSFQTSFIPKKPIDTSNVAIRADNKPRKNPFKIFAVFIFILAMFSSLILYFYDSYLNKQKTELSSELEVIKNSFNEDTISELETFGERISVSSEILSNHIVLSPMFEMIGDLTIPAVWFTSFNHQTTEDGFIVKMSGVSEDFRSIALQAEVFGDDEDHSFKNIVFSDIVKDTDSNLVTFDLQFEVDPSLLSYEENLEKN